MSEVAEQTESNDQVQEQTQSTEKQGYNQIDFKTAAPEEIEARFNRLYGQVKGQQRSLSEYRQIADMQSQKIEELSTNVGLVANHLVSTGFKDAESRANAELASAYESGDATKIAEATNKLVEIRVKQVQTPQEKPQEKKVQVQNNFVNPSDAIREADDMSNDEKSYALAWGNEKDETGNPVRPWFNKIASNGRINPDFAKAALIAQEINEDGRFVTVEQKLAEIDKRMGIGKQTAGSNVMGGRLTGKAKNATIKLSPEKEQMVADIAVKTRFGGAKYKTDAERIQAYKEQIQKISTRKG